MLTSTKLALIAFILLLAILFAPESLTSMAGENRDAIMGSLLLFVAYPLWIAAGIFRAREFFTTLVGRIAFAVFAILMPIVFFAAPLFGRRPRREVAEYE